MGFNALMTREQRIKRWLDSNVWDGEDRSGDKSDWVKHDPDDLLELVKDCLEDVTNEGLWLERLD